jgi:hypothetical protein
MMMNSNLIKILKKFDSLLINLKIKIITEKINLQILILMAHLED